MARLGLVLVIFAVIKYGLGFGEMTQYSGVLAVHSEDLSSAPSALQPSVTQAPEIQ